MLTKVQVSLQIIIRQLASISALYINYLNYLLKRPNVKEPVITQDSKLAVDFSYSNKGVFLRKIARSFCCYVLRFKVSRFVYSGKCIQHIQLVYIDTEPFNKKLKTTNQIFYNYSNKIKTPASAGGKQSGLAFYRRPQGFLNLRRNPRTYPARLQMTFEPYLPPPPSPGLRVRRGDHPTRLPIIICIIYCLRF